ncbi:MAG TPA: hypothetical protein VIK18_16980, partial [Pirellulales bacterium]
NAVNDQHSQLVATRNSGDIAGYNAGVPAYNALVDAYNVEVQTVKNLVDQYNQIVAARNAVAFEEDQLANDLSTTAAPISQ